MEVIVDGTVESCMDRVDSYFRHEWPHGGSFRKYSDRSGNASVVLSAEKRFLFNSWGGLALIAGLSLITFGAFLFLYLVYLVIYLFLEDMAELIPSTYTAQVIARPSGVAQTKIQTSSSRQAGFGQQRAEGVRDERPVDEYRGLTSPRDLILQFTPVGPHPFQPLPPYRHV